MLSNYPAGYSGDDGPDGVGYMDFECPKCGQFRECEAERYGKRVEWTGYCEPCDHEWTWTSDYDDGYDGPDPE